MRNVKDINTLVRNVQLETPDFLNTRGGRGDKTATGATVASETGAGASETGAGVVGPESPLSWMSQLVSVLLIFMIKDSGSPLFLFRLK